MNNSASRKNSEASFTVHTNDERLLIHKVPAHENSTRIESAGAGSIATICPPLSLAPRTSREVSTPGRTRPESKHPSTVRLGTLPPVEREPHEPEVVCGPKARH